MAPKKKSDPTAGNQFWLERVQMLNNLKAESHRIEKQMAKIRSEVEAALAEIKAKEPIQQSRTLEEKLVLTAARQIIQALKQRLPKEEAEAAAIRAARSLAERLGMGKVPQSVVNAIKRKVDERFA